MNMWSSLGILIGCPTRTKGRYHNEARTTARCNGNYGQHHPHHLHQIVGSNVTEDPCQLPHQFHQGPIDLEAKDMHSMANATGSLDAI